MASNEVQYIGDMQDAYNEGYVDGWTDSECGDMNKPSNLVAVVFCKDCQWLKRNPPNGFQDSDLIGTCDRLGMYVKTMEYCSKGRKRK